MKTVEAIIDEQGDVRLLEPIHATRVRRAFVTILEEGSGDKRVEDAALSEGALAQDWNRPEEDAAWAHLKRDQIRPHHS